MTGYLISLLGIVGVLTAWRLERRAEKARLASMAANARPPRIYDGEMHRSPVGHFPNT